MALRYSSMYSTREAHASLTRAEANVAIVFDDLANGFSQAKDRILPGQGV